MDKNELFKKISESLIFGNLGFFVGAGFTKALSVDGLSWEELIKEAASKTIQVALLDKNATFEFGNISLNGKSYPEVATEVCKRISSELGIDYNSACKAFKARICEITLLHPRESIRKEYNKHFKNVAPSWIITTNYDTILESILEENYVSFSPDEILLFPNGKTPVYHLHGHRSDPDSLVILNEDYIKLFRPNEYRQIKLSLLLKESTTVFIGYGLGDFNVLTAVDWANNVFINDSTKYPHYLIQVVYKKDNPASKPYVSDNGVIIIETDNLNNFMEELNNFYSHELIQYNSYISKATNLRNRLVNAFRNEFDEFIDNSNYRRSLLNEFNECNIEVSSAFLTFLSNCLDTAWERTRPNGAFTAYADIVEILIDIFSIINDKTFPEVILNLVVTLFDRLTWYIGNGNGESHSAQEYWDNNKSKITPYMLDYLKTYADNTWQRKMKQLL